VSHPPGERVLGKAIVDARKVVATRSHSGASYHRPPQPPPDWVARSFPRDRSTWW
jgi:hypothetical protein